MDDKLKEILENKPTRLKRGVVYYQTDYKKWIAQIKQVFIDDSLHEAVAAINGERERTPDRMSGLEWYERFMQELGEDPGDNLYTRAAKKASNL